MRLRGTLASLALLLGTTVAGFAADITVVEAPEAPLSADIAPERFGWTGVYVGVAAGYGWLRDVDYAPPPGLPVPYYDKGEDWVLGGHIGYLHQWGPFVAGVEAEYNRLDIAYEGLNFITVEDAFTAKARVGAAWDRFLFTADAGAVYARTNFLGLKDWGWTAGVGVDYALTDNVTIGGHYSHYRFTEFDGTAIDAKIDLLTARFGYKF